MEDISIALHSAFRCTAVELEVGRMLNHDHVTPISAGHLARVKIYRKDRLPNAVDNAIQLKSPSRTTIQNNPCGHPEVSRRDVHFNPSEIPSDFSNNLPVPPVAQAAKAESSAGPTSDVLLAVAP
jgi:hypothetical protein